MKGTKANVSGTRSKRPALETIHVEVPNELSAHDLRQAALALYDVVEDVLPNTLAYGERVALADVAAWLQGAAKVVDPRDAADWDTVLAVRESREQRDATLLYSARYGVSEASMREATRARQIDASRRRIVR